MSNKTHSPSMRKRTTSPCASPEFEFWMVRNPSFPQPNILTADQLIVNGVLLPLHLLNKPDPSPPVTDSSAPVITDSTVTASSKRWKDIFKKSNNKKNAEKNDVVAEEKKKEKKNKSGITSASAELNINIWPFSRSKSAGIGATRPKLFSPAARKAHSAPCSRSNSAGESKSRKWPTSPARPGVHLGRTSPVWQLRRPKININNNNNNTESLEKPKRRSKVTGGGNGTAKTRVLNLNVPMCIGYRHHLSCRSDENGGIGVSGNSIRNSNNSIIRNTGNSNIGGKLFNLRNLFTKKTVVASH